MTIIYAISSQNHIRLVRPASNFSREACDALANFSFSGRSPDGKNAPALSYIRLMASFAKRAQVLEKSVVYYILQPMQYEITRLTQGTFNVLTTQT